MIPRWAHYRPEDQPGQSCGTCTFYDNGLCEMFEDTPVEKGMVCDRWKGIVDKEGQLTGGSPRYFEQDEVKGMAEMVSTLEPHLAKADETRAAGIAVRAADTGRVLMIQRAARADDPAGGKWEFPGGCLNDGEHPHDGARREWQEEMGARLPRGRHVSSWRSGVYQGFVHEVPREASVKINLDPSQRRVLNPDDPDGDAVEVAAWWHPGHLKRSGAVRDELRAARPWNHVAKADGSVLLISHAKTRHNRPGEPHDIVSGWRNPPLDSGGLKQARDLGHSLKGAGIDAIHASDLTRARKTAEIVGRAVGVDPVVSSKYRPWDLGDFAGHSSEQVVPKLKPYMGAGSSKPVDGGESFDDFKNRFLPAFEALLKKAEQGQTVALVTHSRNIELVQGWLKGRAPRQRVDTSAITSDKIDPATVLHVTRDRNSGRWLPEKAVDLTVRKGDANPATLHLRVHGVSTTPSNHRVYRMVTRDGQYVGRTNATRVRARKGDVLKVQAADLLQDAMGDMRWTNPNVVSQYTDAPQSWRELVALAGGELEKDGPPPSGGDAPGDAIPPAGDEGDNHFPSGPTLEAVHIPVPLPDLSIGYQMTRRVGRKREDVLRGEFLPVTKAGAMKQLVYGVVLEPNSLDSQNDYMLPKAVEATAHGYLKRAIRGTSRVHKLQHRGRVNVRSAKKTMIPVESFIAPVDFSYDGKEMIKAGSWVLVVHVEDPALWQDFLDGKYRAFSVGGTGVRQSLSRPEPEVPRGWIASDANDWHPNPSDLGLSTFI